MKTNAFENLDSETYAQIKQIAQRHQREKVIYGLESKIEYASLSDKNKRIVYWRNLCYFRRNNTKGRLGDIAYYSVYNTELTTLLATLGLNDIPPKNRKDFCSLITFAIKQNNLEAVKILISKKSFVCKSKSRMTFLIACNEGNIEIVNYLLSLDCRSELIEENDTVLKSLLIAIKNENVELVKLLLSVEGYDISECARFPARLYNSSESRTVLKMVISIRNAELMRVILETGKFDENTLLEGFFTAAKNGSESVVQVLFANDHVKKCLNTLTAADKNEFFRRQCQQGHADVVKLINTHWDDVKIIFKEKSPLTKCYWASCMELLLSRDDAEEGLKRFGSAALLNILQRADHGYPDTFTICKMLVNRESFSLKTVVEYTEYFIPLVNQEVTKALLENVEFCYPPGIEEGEKKTTEQYKAEAIEFCKSIFNRRDFDAAMFPETQFDFVELLSTDYPELVEFLYEKIGNHLVLAQEV